MARFKMKTGLLTALVLLAGLTLGGETLHPRQPLSKNAGCSRIDNATATYGSCTLGGGGCYYCEYSYPGGQSACYESPSGDFQYCTDFQY
ncbi:MAG: hypothetical protein ABIS20_11325 [Thermoanaerobaculia bacterium]